MHMVAVIVVVHSPSHPLPVLFCVLCCALPFCAVSVCIEWTIIWVIAVNPFL